MTIHDFVYAANKYHLINSATYLSNIYVKNKLEDNHYHAK